MKWKTSRTITKRELTFANRTGTSIDRTACVLPVDGTASLVDRANALVAERAPLVHGTAGRAESFAHSIVRLYEIVGQRRFGSAGRVIEIARGSSYTAGAARWGATAVGGAGAGAAGAAGAAAVATLAAAVVVVVVVVVVVRTLAASCSARLVQLEAGVEPQARTCVLLHHHAQLRL